jgi:hypothetical protein
MTDDEDVQLEVTIKGIVKTTNRNFCTETYLKEVTKLLESHDHICPNTEALGSWDYTTHYSLNKMLVNGTEVEITKPCCKDDEIKIEDKWQNVP